ncbi:16S rRNA (uracil(1498)-N(3))-methyltransferase [Actinomycetaceae bacterium MB13-C1-2]|nr:16S rRNA (uracil(1498)-N(3))-methyltransferase [Actinomycetaceae bacterium MB13-C1-2]
MTASVFFAPEVLVDGHRTPLRQVTTSSSTLILDGDEGRHAARVQRIRPGERLDLVDGQGVRVVSEAVGTNQDGLEVRAMRAIQEMPRSPELILVQALAKGGRDEQAIETATELGVDRVIPWQADRSIVKWSPQKVKRGVERWQKVLTAAMKQSRRAFLPGIGDPVSSKQLTAEVGSWTESGDLVLVCHEEATVPLSQVLASTASNGVAPARVVLLVGPEGGVSPEEIDGFKEAGATPVILGPEVLRSSTAGPAALVAANLHLGRW